MSLREGSMRFLVLLIATAAVAWGQSVSAGNWNLKGASGPASSSAMPSLVSISLTPANPSQYAGSAVGFSAMGTYSDGSIQDLTGSVTWNSSNATVASLSALGSPQNVNCLNPGTSTVTASVGALSGSTVLTCSTTQVSLPDSSLLSWDTSMANSPQSTPSNICVGTLANPGSISCTTTYTAAQYQTALNNAACGQTIILQNTTYGDLFNLPHGSAVNCPANNWIIITRDTTDTTFPAEGQRVDPCFIGIPHSAMLYLPYPSWDTSTSCARHMPQIITNTSGGVDPVSIPAGVTGVSISHWRFVGLEVTRGGAANSSLNYDISLGLISLIYQPSTDCAVDANNNPTNPITCMNDAPTNIIFDRMVVHGDPIHQTKRCWDLGGSRFVAILDSYCYDIGLTYAGGGGDAQAIAAGNGKGFTNVGFGKFVNNFLSASTETGAILCGSFVEPLSPVTGFDGIPQSMWFAQNHIYKNPLWDTQLGYTLNETVAIEGQDYGPANDQELTVTPTALQLQLGQQFQFQTVTLNDSASALNLLQGLGAGNTPSGVKVDGVTPTSTTGLITENGEHAVGSAGWNSQNQITWTYVACSGSGAPIAACTGATTTGAHSVVFTYYTKDDRLATLGANRGLTATATVTVVSGTPTKQIAVSPAAPDLQIQPSYSDIYFNNRKFCYTFFWFANYTPALVAWSVDGTAGGNATVGTVQTGLTGLASSEAIYCSGTATGIHNVTATASDGTTNTSPINVSTSASILAFDLKAFTMKNSWELKCGHKILLEKSLIEFSPGTQGNGGGQPGTALLIQSLNQANQTLDGSGVNVGYGPEITEDVTIDHNRFAYSGKGPSINPFGIGVSLGTHRVALTNNIFDDTNYQRYGHGWLTTGFVTMGFGGSGSSTTRLPWTSPTTPVMDNVTYNHNTETGLQPNVFSISDNLYQYTEINLNITNSIINADGSANFINPNGETGDCDTAGGSGSNNTETKGISACWNPYQLNHLALTNNTSTPCCGPGDIFLSTTTWQPAASATDLFASYNGGKDGDYRVCTGAGVPTASCTANTYGPGGSKQASDGLALGADVVGVNAAVTAVKTGTRTP